MTNHPPVRHPAYSVCPLCEATCGLELTIAAGAVSGVRDDRDDVFSKGFICPKGAAFDRLENDPDRSRRPMVRDGDPWREVGWEETFAAVSAGLGQVVAKHGRQAVGIYLGTRTCTPSLPALQQHDTRSASISVLCSDANVGLVT